MHVIVWIICAFIVDLILGDPYSWPHPVKLIGNYIYFFQRQFCKETNTQKQNYWLGIWLWSSTVIGTVFLTVGVLWLSFQLHTIVGMICFIYLSYTTLATKSLAIEGKQVYQKLTTGTIEEARKQVGMIVGRETSELTKSEIANATIETIAENASDGVVAPVLYLFLGGPVLAMIYKAVNTLDSMVGYQTPKYKELGYVSAKMDDLWNLIPARITWLLLVVSSKLLGFNTKNAWLVGRRDCRKHKSPNSGYPESVAAGALEIQLGGSHVYHGVEIAKPYIGDAKRAVTAEDIQKMNQLLYTTACLAVGSFSLIAYIGIILFR